MIFNPFSAAPVHKKSHVRGWSQHWADKLNTIVALKTDDYLTADILYLDHGVNYAGGLNLFGGVTQEVFDNLLNLVNSKAQLVSLDIPMPDYALMLSTRAGNATCHPKLMDIINKLEFRFKSATTLMQQDLDLENLIIGDSHATSYAESNTAVIRKNGQTLYGALKNNFIQSEMLKTTKKYSKVTLALGSIDIRHHIMRLDMHEKELSTLVDNYISILRQIKSEYHCEIEIAIPHPIEYEQRRIPQTGFYKGTAFYGSITSRSNLLNLFINQVEQNNIKIIRQPNYRYLMDPKAYADQHMELGSSVHLSPVSYRYNSDWRE